MMTSDDKVGGWVKKGQNHDDVILECPLTCPPRAELTFSPPIKAGLKRQEGPDIIHHSTRLQVLHYWKADISVALLL